MKAALVKAPGTLPVYADFAEPAAAEGAVRVKVTASALSHVAKSRASGKHYSAASTFPFVAGVDGVGTLDDGTRVYFVFPEAPSGAMAEYCFVKKNRCIPLPSDLNDVSAAAIAIPGMSSWAALVERARLVKGETVLINGATGCSGRLAVQVAKHLGASKVIATGRHAQSLQSLQALGADVTISLAQDKDALAAEFRAHFKEGVGVVLDYLWGPSAELLLAGATQAAPDAVPIRFVQIGAISGPDITLPSATLRSTAIELMGSGIGSVPMPRILDAVKQLLHAAGPSGFQVAARSVPLAEVEQHWTDDESRERTVFVMG
ncbi:zinc-binding alcohol dehydrogenase family protein [Paraburkholderia sp. DHOC27]|uniref:quinone oxidoreductase family protein n=1 Tax=Paraburkholderia sp. DHOC27 TaxID=2303330 RepID=UPI000E3D5958|nr:zinc-binding alcohol dehydrogenase family protein [Paraburkholderia sp. DHOC27]RFU48946.1 zinc-binding alcohol dehydrogenase family protein [Paraburkholderia sp. DHOC27]